MTGPNTDPRFEKFEKQMREKIKNDGYNAVIINLAWNVALLKKDMSIYKTKNVFLPDNFIDLENIEH